MVDKDSTLLASEGPLAQGTPREDRGDPEAEAFEVGAFVGTRYRIVRFIARGGMGEVYEAFDEELRVPVALKVATRTTGRALDRFKREVMLARRVTHKNVCRLFEIGFETVRGESVPYCTMELLQGETLSARLERGKLPLADARAIIEQIATGLQAAHDVGVIHRDFKSNNILLVKDSDGRERAVISDFGLARAETSIVGDGSALTADQALVGTPAYMAPEQVECKPATTATDIYALGVVMFELVTGDLPFRADTPMATAVLRLTQAPPSVRTKRPELSASWDRAIAKCLEVAPASRFARAGDVIEALDARVPRMRRLLPWLVAGGLVAAGSAAAVVAVMAHGHREHTVAAPRVLPPRGAHVRGIVVVDPIADAPWRATEAGELLRAELRVPGFVKPLDGDETASLARQLSTAKDPEGTKAAIVHIGGTTTAQLLITSELAKDSLKVHLVDLVNGEDVGSYAVPVAGDDVAAAVAQLGAQLRPMLAGADVPLDADHAAKVLPAQPDAARSYAEGLGFGRTHDHEKAIAALEQTTTLAKDFAPGFLALAGEYRAVRQQAKAGEAAEFAFRLASSLRSDQQIVAEALYREALKDWKAAARLWSDLLKVDPDNVTVANSLARVKMQSSDANGCYEVLDQERERPDPIGDDPRLDVQEALCARQAGDFTRARSAATRAEMKAGFRGVPEVQAMALALEGEMLGDGGEYDRALVVLGRSRHVAETLGDGEGVIEALRQSGNVLHEQDRNAEAIAMYKDAMERAKQLGDRIAQSFVLDEWGQAIERPQDALPVFQQALAIANEEGDERLATAALLNIANKQDGIGKSEEAIATYHDVIARATKLGDLQNLATAEMNESDSLIKLDRNREAVPLIGAALASFKERGDENGVGYALATRGDAKQTLADFAGSRADYEESIALRKKLGEAHNLATVQRQLARLDIAEDRLAEAEPLMLASLAQHRKEKDSDNNLVEDLRSLGRVQALLGKHDEALASVAESEKHGKPDDASPEASEIAFVRALADPAHADAQLAIIRATEHNKGCVACEVFGRLDEAEFDLATGKKAEARRLLLDVQRRAKAIAADNIIDRVARLLKR